LMIREGKKPDTRARDAACLPAREASRRRQWGLGSGSSARLTRRLRIRHGKASRRSARRWSRVFVTFADLMGLLASFFVMLVAFSTQDQAKLQVVAGSMRMRSLSRIVSVIPALTGLAGHGGNLRGVEAHYARGDQAEPQCRDCRSGRALNVP